MSNMIEIKQRVFNQPLLMSQDYGLILFGALSEKLDVSELTYGASKLSGDELKALAGSYNGEHGQPKPYEVKNGTALIDITGSLVAKSGYLSSMSGITGYNTIKGDLDFALNDDDVTGITFMMSSSGGEVTGCFELADYIYRNRGSKKMTALVTSIACSACYILASACDEILVSETATIGSVGVIMGHTSIAEMMKMKGVKVTLMTAGDHKADGNQYEDLPKEVYDKKMGELKEIRMMFVNRVSKYRSMSVESIFSTEAQTYLGQAAVDIGLADGIVSHIDYIENLSRSGSNINLESNNMADGKEPEVEHEKALADATAAGKAAGVKQGGVDMQTRIKGILMSDKAAGKTKMAQHLAFNTSMSVEEAEAMLDVSAGEPAAVVAEPVEAPEAAAATSFQKQMEAEKGEDIGDSLSGEDDAALDVNSIEYAMAAAKAINGGN